MINIASKSFQAKLLVIFVAIISFLAIFTKGWLIFFLLPASIIILPLYIILEFIAIKQHKGPHIKHIRLVRQFFTFTLLVAYACLPGIYDGPGTLLGFFVIESESLVYLLYAIGWLSFIVSGFLCITLITLLIMNRYKKIN